METSSINTARHLLSNKPGNCKLCISSYNCYHNLYFFSNNFCIFWWLDIDGLVYIEVNQAQDKLGLWRIKIKYLMISPIDYIHYIDHFTVP